MPLTPCSDVSAADWIARSDQPWQQLVTFGPGGFPTYARLRFLPDPAPSGLQEPSHAGDGPDECHLLGIAVDVLATHTHTPSDAYFCLWDGWGLPSELQGLPTVVVPERSFVLFRGALADFADWGSPQTAETPSGLGRELPAFIWPADHAWCVARDVDPHYSGIGAATEAISQLVAHPALDVVPAIPGQPQPYYF